MKVCLVTLRHEFRNSGEIESIINLQNYLGKNGIEADILTPRGFYTASMAESKSGLSFGKVVDLWRLYRTLQQHHRKYDIIHLFLPFPSFSFYGDFIKHKLRGKVVVTFESCILTMEGAGIVRLFRYEPISNLLRLCINNYLFAKVSLYAADAYIVSSNYQKKQLALKKICAIPNLTNTKKFKKVERHKAKKSLDFPNNAFVISYIGHLLEIKGVTDLLLAFSMLSKNNDNIKLALAFSGIGYLDKVKVKIKKLNISDKVIFFGSVNVSDFLSASDLLVVPYRYSFGTNWIPSVLLEGFSVGIPILTSDLTPLRELNEYQEVLLFAKAGDPAHLASKINMLMNDEKKLRTIVRNQSVLMDTTLNPDILIEEYINVYKRVQNEKD